MSGKLGRILLAAALIMGFSSLTLQAQDNYPSKPVEMIVTFPAGGGQDTTMRIIAKYAEKYLGQRIVVVNMTGGGNITGSIYTLNSKPDGYTIGTWVEGLVTDSLNFKDVPYTYKSFEPLCFVGADPHVLTIRKDMGINDFHTFVKYCHENPGQVTYSIGGNWNSHDFMRIKITNAAKLDVKRIPYAGGAPALRDVAAGAVDVSAPLLPEILTMLDTGRLIPLAVASDERVAQLPDVPTFKELGYDVSQAIWRCLTLPKGTPKPIFDKLESVFKQTLEDPECLAALHKAGANPIWKDHVELAQFLEKEYEYYSTTLKEWGIEPR